MVVLTMDAPKKKHKVYFDQPVPKPRFVSLLSCSLYNTWHNLKHIGSISYKADGSSFDSGPVPPGHYKIDTLTDYLTKNITVFTGKRPFKIATFDRQTH